MGIDIRNISYLAFRLAPFIIVCFFILQSLLNWDLKGLIYLAGLLFTSVIVILLKGPMDSMFPEDKINDPEPDQKCKTITLGDGGNILSSIPLGISTYSYTFFYMFIFIFNLGNGSSKGILGGKLSSADLNAAFRQNIPTMIIFPLLIILEVAWQMIYKCTRQPVFFITAAIIIGGIVGVLWAITITSLNNNDLMYLSKSGVETCSRPSTTYFSCKKASGSVTTSTGSAS
jgi:hypothetical protein